VRKRLERIYMFRLLRGTALKRWTAAAVCLILISVFPLPAQALERYQILMLGDKDKYVLELQKALYENGYLKHRPTGYFGTDTQSAVMKLQKDRDIRQDGKAGPETQKAVMGKKYEAIPSTRKVKPESGANAIKCAPGEKGDDVKEYQERLKSLEYYTYSKISGYYGPATKLAVKRFQRTNGLPVNGVLNGDAIALLKSGDAKSYTIYPGDKGDDVKALQKRLKELGYDIPGDATGYFGDITEAAVRQFQKVNKLEVDGKAGKNTRKLIFSDSAKKNTGKSVPAGKPKASKQTRVEKMLAIAKEQLGKRYVWSREGPDCYDCSGLVYYVMTRMGIHTTRFSADGFSKVPGWTNITKTSALKPGDLLFWRNGSSSTRIGHTGIYLGNGKFIHASSSQRRVVISDLTGYYERNFSNARRII
jgi:peptidoglycan hydrolase-like protein with peptidoglycan-binding domain